VPIFMLAIAFDYIAALLALFVLKPLRIRWLSRATRVPIWQQAPHLTVSLDAYASAAERHVLPELRPSKRALRPTGWLRYNSGAVLLGALLVIVQSS